MKLRCAIFCCLVLTAISGCSGSVDDTRARVSVVDDSAPITSTKEDSSRINPVGINLSYASATARSAVAKGLVGLDEEGRVVPAIASRWIVTDDGLSYIFRLSDSKWDDGRKITAERIETLLKARIKELSKSRLGPDLATVDQIISMTGRVIEIRLTTPHPNFLQLMAQPEMGLLRAGHGAGPMSRVTENIDGVLTLGPFSQREQDDEDDTAQEDDRRIYLRGESAAKALARFDLGHVDVILNGRFQHLPLVDASDVSSDDLLLDPVAGLFGLRFETAEGYWALPKNRRSLAMAIDRPALLTSFPGVTAWQARQKIVPEALDIEGINARPDWAAMTMEERRAFAAADIAEWESAREQIPPLRIALPKGAGADILFLRIRSDLRAVGLDARKVALGAKTDVRLIDMIAPYDSASWFLTRFTCDLTPICLNDADEKMAEAEAADDLPTKARLYAEAEILLVQHYMFIPLATPVRWSVERAGQSGLAPNPRGWHPLNPLVGIPISGL